jgi:hypothetical protein
VEEKKRAYGHRAADVLAACRVIIAECIGLGTGAVAAVVETEGPLKALTD